MDRGENPAPCQERAKDGKGKGQDDEDDVPDLEHAFFLLDHDRMKVGCAGEPGQERGVLHGIPGPVAAPSEYPIRPPGAKHITQSQEEPGKDRPTARAGNPFRTQTPGDQCRESEGERDREAHIANVKRWRMKEHAGVLEKRIQPAPVGRREGKTLKWVCEEDQHRQKENGYGHGNGDNIGHKLTITPSILPGNNDHKNR